MTAIAPPDPDTFASAVWEHPVEFASEWLGVHCWPKQADALRMITRNRLTAIKSGHAVGKTFLAAMAVFLFLLGRRSILVTTATGYRGTAKGVWPAVHAIANRLPPEHRIGGRLNDTSWHLGPQWEAFAVAANEAENFASFRSARGTDVIVDEASGISDAIFDAIMGLIAGGGRLVLLGNPIRPTGRFAEAFRDPAWATMTISSLDAADAGVPGLADWEWIESRKAAWGADSDRYRTRVLGEFPSGDALTILPVDWIEHILQDPPAERGELRLGVDVARFGQDSAMLVLRDDYGYRDEIEITKCSLMDLVGRVRKAMEDWSVPARRVYVDDSGLGGGVTDRLREEGFDVRAINFGKRASDPDHFANIRAECYWNMREAFNPHTGIGAFRVPRRFGQVVEEAGLPEVDMTSRGQIRLEAKDRVIRKNEGRSPDRADALAMSFAPDESEDAGGRLFVL